MKKHKSIFDILEHEQQVNYKTHFADSSYFCEEDHNEEAKESNVGSSFNYFKDSHISGEEYFMDESDIDDNKSSFISKNEQENLYNYNNNNSLLKESDFIKISRLGSGSYGQAFKAKHKETNKIYAIKEINKAKLIKENKYYQAIIENEMLKICSHPNIVKYFGFYETSENFAIIEEYCPYGDFSSFINENKQNLSILEIQYIIGQIIICLEYLSTKNIIHRDIKPENFLLTDNFNLKLIDFGTSTFIGKIFDIKTNKFIDDNCKGPKHYSDSFIFPHQFNEEQHPVTNNSGSTSFKYKLSDIFNIFTYPFSSSEEKNNSTKFEDIKRQKFVGTAEYMAPEIINSKKTGFYTDMWSVICILFFCFTGNNPFTDKTEYLIFQNISSININKNNLELIPKDALDLIKNYFKEEPSKRIGYKSLKDFDFNKIKCHPFFKLKGNNISLAQIRQSLMNKCSYYNKSLTKNNKIQNTVNFKNLNINKKYNHQKKIEESKNEQNETILKCGLLKKQSPYYYYDLRKIVLYDTPRIDYIDPEKGAIKGRIILTKECAAQLTKSNQFKLYTPKRTFVFMCKERYNISPWVSAINYAIEKYG